MLLADSLREYVDGQMGRLARVRFRPDPLLGSYSGLHSLLSSAPKRHGSLIELAICEALRESGVYRIWRRVKFEIPATADLITTSQDALACIATSLPYGGGRAIQTDLIAYQVSSKRVGAYEIKRANGPHDSGKIRSLRRDVTGTQTVLSSYAEHRLGLSINQTISRVIFYYGRGLLPAPWSLTAADLDDHFGCRVRSIVEAATSYFHFRLTEYLQEIDVTGLNIRQLELELAP